MEYISTKGYGQEIKMKIAERVLLWFLVLAVMAVMHLQTEINKTQREMNDLLSDRISLITKSKTKR